MASQNSGGNDEFQITNINVTPLVDIMLVLLVIFMVTTTYIVKEAISVNLPKAASTSQSTPRTLQLTISKEGRSYLEAVEVDDAALVRRVRELATASSEVQVVISADRDARHGSVVHALDLMKGEGITKFAIQVEKERRP